MDGGPSTQEVNVAAQPLPALAAGDPSVWDQALYAFLVEKGNRSGSTRTVESYSRMLWPFFHGRTPDVIRPARLTTRLEKLKQQHALGRHHRRVLPSAAGRGASGLGWRSPRTTAGSPTSTPIEPGYLTLPEAIAVASAGPARGVVPDRATKRDGARPGGRVDRLDTGRPTVLRISAGVPPRGFEPLISTLKGWRPRPLDDGG